MPLELNRKPFFDDFNEDKKYARILFRPSYAVQARELTQIQTILQKQLERLGDWVFKDGSLINGGQISLDLNCKAVKLSALGSGVDIEDFEGGILTNGSGAKFKVLKAVPQDVDNGVDLNTLIVNDIAGKSFTAAQNVFLAGNSSVSGTFDSITDSSLASIDEGTYYAQDLFLRVTSQSIPVEVYSKTPTKRVGLQIIESVITEADDETLNDPAEGSNNFAAPGAHRYKIDLVLTTKDYDPDESSVENSADNDFIELLRVDNGVIRKVIRYPFLSGLEETLARRTFDESGNYTVRYFPIRLQSHPDEDSANLATAAAGRDKFRVGLDPGKALIKGFEFETVATEYLDVDRARDVNTAQNDNVVAQYGNYIVVNDFTAKDEYFDPTIYHKVDLHSSDVATVQTATNTGEYVSTQIGTARLRQVKYHSGTFGGGSEKYRMYLFDIDLFNITPGDPASGSYRISDLESVHMVTTGGGAPTFHAAADIAAEGRDNSGATTMFGSGDNAMIFPLGQKAVKTLTPNGISDTNYELTKKFTLTFSGGVATVATTESNTSFIGPDGAVSDDIKKDNYLIFRDSDGEIFPWDTATNSRSLTLSNNGQNAQFTGEGGFTDGDYTLYAVISKNVAVERSKSLIQNATITINNDLTGSWSQTFGRSDIVSIVSVVTNNGAGADVTSKFLLDNGQRDNIYDHGNLILKPGETQDVDENDTSTYLLVTFNYFTHTGEGFFSVDSYGVDYEDIPVYTSPSTGVSYDLRDVMDFRPRRLDYTQTSTLNFPTTDEMKVSTSTRARLPVPNNIMDVDYEYYLSRIDKVILTKDRKFEIIKGVPSLTPSVPRDLSDAMSLYVLEIPAYTFNNDAGRPNVKVTFIDNKRYTMRDIGRLEKRIDSLEYYTSLSLLEKNTQNLLVKDENGDDRFKNGILVDPFSGHAVGDVANTDYNCSIDFRKRELNVPFVSNNVRLSLNTSLSSGVTKTGDLITVPFTETTFIDQPLASNWISVNPFDVVTFNGTVNLTPENDIWVDTERRPDVVVNLQGENDAWEFGENFTFTEWDDWNTRILGEQIVNTEVDRHVRRERITRTRARQTVTRTRRDTVLVSTERTREGIEWTATVKEVRQELGDRVVDVSVIPFIRSQTISFSAEGLKPNTRMYAFFDGTSVDQFVAWTVNNITDSTGKISGTLTLPAGTFRVGQRIFRLTDSSTGVVTSTNSVADAFFFAQGLVRHTQNTIVSTRQPQFTSSRSVTDTELSSDVIQRESSRVRERVVPRDPVAQTFFVGGQDNPNGVFISSVDIYFKNKPQNSDLPVTMEIRPTSNGYPHSFLTLPFSVVTKDIGEVTTSEDASAATNFAFNSPIYLAPGEYSIVLLSNDSDYEVFYAETGELQLNTQRRISAQPYIGSFFSSQNSSTWTPDQNKDLMFKINRCSFETGGVHEAVLASPATSEILYDLINVSTSELNFEPTGINYFIKRKDEDGAAVDTDWTEIPINTNVPLSNRSEMISANDFRLLADMFTDDEKISPVIDTSFTSVVTVKHLINTDSSLFDSLGDDQELLSRSPSTVDGNDYSQARYITRRVTLNSGLEGEDIRVYFDAYKPNQTNIRVYYKILPIGSDDSFDDVPYVEMDQETNSSTVSLNNDDFREYSYRTAGGIGTTTKDDLGDDVVTKFSTMAIKLVMTSSDPTIVPKVKDLRVIALDSPEVV